MVKKRSILFYGHEVGNQMALMARKSRARGIDALSVNIGQNNRTQWNDIALKKTGIWLDIQRFFFGFWAMYRFDVFHFFYGVSLWSFGKYHHLDLWLLKRLGKKIVVHYRGSELVNPEYYRFLASPVTNEIPPVYFLKERERWCHDWEKYADEILVSTPNLLPISNRAQWFPQVIDLQEWPYTFQPLEHTCIVGHAPTRRNLKGTDWLIDLLKQVQSDSFSITLKCIENNPQPGSAMAAVDIGVDQFIIGWYGKVAVEWMALGRPVMVYIQTELIPQGAEVPPIIQTSIKTFLSDLNNYLQLPEEQKKALTLKARAYVEKFHDVEKELDRLFKLYFR